LVSNCCRRAGRPGSVGQATEEGRNLEILAGVLVLLFDRLGGRRRPARSGPGLQHRRRIAAIVAQRRWRVDAVARAEQAEEAALGRARLVGERAVAEQRRLFLDLGLKRGEPKS